MIRAFPKGMHPMTQLSSAILAMQTDSVFAAEYAKGTSKALYWEHTYEDMLNLLARLPEVCALIYRTTYFDGVVPPRDTSVDYSGNFCKMLGQRTRARAAAAPCLRTLGAALWDAGLYERRWPPCTPLAVLLCVVPRATVLRWRVGRVPSSRSARLHAPLRRVCRHQRPRLRGAHAAVHCHPLGSRGRQRLGAHVPPGGGAAPSDHAGTPPSRAPLLTSPCCATWQVGSTLSDPYLALSASMNALAGPLHGLANQARSQPPARAPRAGPCRAQPPCPHARVPVSRGAAPRAHHAAVASPALRTANENERVFLRRR
jgi:hypothetical protein